MFIQGRKRFLLSLPIIFNTQLGSANVNQTQTNNQRQQEVSTVTASSDDTNELIAEFNQSAKPNDPSDIQASVENFIKKKDLSRRQQLRLFKKLNKRKPSARAKKVYDNDIRRLQVHNKITGIGDVTTSGRNALAYSMSINYSDDSAFSRSHDVGFNITYGLLDNLDVFVNIPSHNWTILRGAPNASGFNDLSFGTRYVKSEISKDTDLSFNANVSVPTGSYEQGYGGGFFNFSPSVSLAKTLYLNIWNAQVSANAGMNVPFARQKSAIGDTQPGLLSVNGGLAAEIGTEHFRLWTTLDVNTSRVWNFRQNNFTQTVLTPGFDIVLPSQTVDMSIGFPIVLSNSTQGLAFFVSMTYQPGAN